MNTTFRKMYTPEEIKAIAGGGGAGLEVIEITDVPTTSTSGTLNEAQMAIVNSDTPSCVKFNNEYYYKNDDNHTDGIAVYTHTGYTETDGGSTIKYFSITLATAAWTLTSTNLPAKLYLHKVVFTASAAGKKYYLLADFILTRSTPYTAFSYYLEDYYNKSSNNLYIGVTPGIGYQHPLPPDELIVSAYIQKTSSAGGDNVTIVCKDLSSENWMTNNYMYKEVTIDWNVFKVDVIPL